MKRNIVGLLVAAALTVSSALASKIVFTDAPPDWSGGPFTAQFVTDSNVPIGPSFLTFCLERNEYVQFGVPASYTIAQGATGGGGGSSGGIDPISIGTAWLYYQFRTVSTFAPDNATRVDLQRTIWYLEDEGNEGGYLYGSSSMYAAAKTALGVTDAGMKLDANGAYGVWVINPVYNNQIGQSMLGIPDGGFTLVLLGIAMGLLGFLGRRFR